MKTEITKENMWHVARRLGGYIDLGYGLRPPTIVIGSDSFNLGEEILLV